MRVHYRLRQTLSYLRNARRSAPPIPPAAEALLSPPMRAQFLMLPAVDQRHCLRVYRYLDAHGADADTLTAGLIHDVGKACRRCRVTVVHRAAHVLLARFAGGPYRRFAAMKDAPAPLRTMHILATHPRRGARAAAQAGYNPRVCQLVREHESGGEPDDAGLRLLRQADARAGAEWDRGER
jgi:hypothetical protein